MLWNNVPALRCLDLSVLLCLLLILYILNLLSRINTYVQCYTNNGDKNIHANHTGLVVNLPQTQAKLKYFEKLDMVLPQFWPVNGNKLDGLAQRTQTFLPMWVTVEACYQAWVILTTESPIFKLKVPTGSVEMLQLHRTATVRSNTLDTVFRGFSIIGANRNVSKQRPERKYMLKANRVSPCFSDTVTHSWGLDS